jgi:hypothetical protein
VAERLAASREGLSSMEQLNYFNQQIVSEYLWLYNIMVHLLHARTVEPQEQPLLSNTPSQQWNNGVMQPVCRKWLGKHTSA